MKIKEQFRSFKESLKNDSRKRNRFIILTLSLLMIFDYLMICYHIERNPFAIFPPFPVMDRRQEVTIFVPDIDGKTLLEESRLISNQGSTDSFIRHLVYMVTRGSKFENTRIAVPIEALVRTVWVEDGRCIVDIRMEALQEDVPVVAGSEENYRNAISKTIMKNIDGINEVIIVENGLYNRNLWELSRLEENTM